MWVRVDDQLHGNPKLLKAWHAHEASIGVHLFALSHAGCYLTDGFVSEAYVTSLIASAAKRRKVTAALEDAVLWERGEGGWWIHDYLEYNDSREQILARRRADSRRKRNGMRAEA